MPYLHLNGVELNALFESGYRNLKKNIDTINNLNVFPVPDGDTGTNMVKTFGGGLRAAAADAQEVGTYMKALADAVLLSARGNSGVIFSQFVHGLARGFAGKQTVDFSDFALAFTYATEDAYKSILTPTEGTILTVIRECAEFLQEHAHEYGQIDSGFAALLAQAKKTLAKTPDLLPVLKEAGVVDSGGAGLVCFLEGMYAYLCGESIEDTPDLADSLAQPTLSLGSFGPDSVLEYGYCTEFILQLLHAKTDIAAFDRDAFVKPLEQMGDSIVAVYNDGLLKIHIHTFAPDEVLAYARRYGEFITIKIENMSVQHSENEAAQKPKEHLKYAIVAVASGQGITEYFTEIGATVIIDGGQTNNPPVEDFLAAFRSVDADHIVVLPNNSNIILTAEQAAEIYTESDVRIIPTKSIVEGYSALSMMNLWCDTVEELIEDMSSGLSSIITGYVTTASRDACVNGVSVTKDSYIGLDRKNILASGDDKLSVAKQLIDRILEKEEKEVIIVFYGKEVSEAEAGQLQSYLEQTYPLIDVGFINGKQGIYDFIISLE